MQREWQFLLFSFEDLRCARISQRGLGRTVSISMAYMLVPPLIIRSLTLLQARSPSSPTSRESLSSWHWSTGTRHVPACDTSTWSPIVLARLWRAKKKDQG